MVLLPASDINDLDREWRLLRNADVSENANLSAIKFWNSVSRTTTGDGAAEYAVLSGFMKIHLCLPHSSAAVERVFSQVNLL